MVVVTFHYSNRKLYLVVDSSFQRFYATTKPTTRTHDVISNKTKTSYAAGFCFVGAPSRNRPLSWISLRLRLTTISLPRAPLECFLAIARASRAFSVRFLWTTLKHKSPNTSHQDFVFYVPPVGIEPTSKG